jgi:hypothetical protein
MRALIFFFIFGSIFFLSVSRYIRVQNRFMKMIKVFLYEKIIENEFSMSKTLDTYFQPKSKAVSRGPGARAWPYRHPYVWPLVS